MKMNKTILPTFIIIAIIGLFIFIPSNPLTWIELKSNVNFPKKTEIIEIKQNDSNIYVFAQIPSGSIADFIKNNNFITNNNYNFPIQINQQIPAGSELYILEESNKFSIIIDKNSGKIWTVAFHADRAGN